MVVVASCFAQILSLIDRTDFARTVRQHAAERAASDPSFSESSSLESPQALIGKSALRSSSLVSVVSS